MKRIIFAFLLVLSLAAMVGAAGVTIEQPYIITSIGQSPDAQMVRVLSNRLELDFTYEQLITPDQLGDYKAILMVVGGSSKGLGAAGIDVDGEIERTAALIKSAKEQGITVVGVHVGGPARRGSLSNQFVEAVFPHAELMVVVAEGNEDGYFTTIAEENGVDIHLIDRVVDMTGVLQEIVK